MKSRTYGGRISRQDAKAEINAMVKEAIQNFRTLSNVSTLTMTDIAELFVRKMLQRLGVPLTEEE